MRRTATTALALVLLGSSVWADVIPSRRSEVDSGAARQAVAGRLGQLGLTAQDASTRASDLLDVEARYFAAHPNRMQLAGRDADEPGVPRGEKMLFGFLGLAASIAVSAFALWGHNR